ncbi:NAD(P)/FAD-dependent oxidoreductase [Methyloligella sp. 2.7D]|uniref:flavin-containing monooxygenase n=1 Tax=unclassified Methyloligella TaxID=2625955 RepID=UPI00157BE57C|nr:NAD(P)/FAD-dependent oxidoreductase [Methyloligella sp. GL2]QKP77934.1 NAD(P)/FAD-dependent oxidoreductase [Methyloligella sp. GL2]
MKKSAGEHRVAIIGAGFSGLAAAIALIKQGIEDFVIFEQEAGLGGTWWNNHYPGAEVDLESHIYSFSFEPYDWSGIYATQEELLDYLNHVAKKWQVVKRIRFGEKVEQVAWNDADHQYTVTTASGEDHGRFCAVISAVGFLNVPLLPPFARGETPFKGVQCHTSRWPHGLEMTGKRVGILGTGSSAVQVVTEAERQAEDVTIFQLEPNWILPKGSLAFTEKERRWFKLPLIYWWKRAQLYWRYDMRQWFAGHARAGWKANKSRAEAALAYLKESLADRPDLLELATPKFPFEARRTVLSDTYYDSLKSPKVHLVPHGAQSLTETGIVDSTGKEYPVDMIVYATGFDAANYLCTLQVKGIGGRDLHQQWAGEPEALLGMMVPGFPNFFMMYGPNTNSVPLVTFYEAQASFAASMIKTMIRRGKTMIDVKPEATQRFNKWLQNLLSKTVWGTTSNYFRAGTGKIVSQWPLNATSYIAGLKLAKLFAVRMR